MINRTVVLVAALMACASCVAREANDTMVPGVYGDMTLAVDSRNRRVSGVYESEGGYDSEGNPTWTCHFYFSGKSAGGKASVVVLSHMPDSEEFSAVNGEVVSDPQGGGPGIRIKIKNDDYPPGCGRGENFSDNSPPIGLDEAQPLTEIRLVAANKARFHTRPDAASIGRSYVIRGDVVQVLERRGAFVKVNYVGESAVTSGWLKEADLQPL